MKIDSLKERDQNLINNWYIACLSKELKRKPIKRVIYDTPIVLFRDERGRSKALLDRCIHRGAQLSLGHCDLGGIRCPYHGWLYDGNGKVKEVPSNSKNNTPYMPPLRSFLVCEKEGVVWVWMGYHRPLRKEPPWSFPNFKNKNWTNYFMITDFDNEVTNLCENFMDVPHTIYVHKGWFRNQKSSKVPMKIEMKKGEVLVTYNQPNDRIGFTQKLINPKNDKMTHTDRFVFPNITRVDYSFGSSAGFIINSQCTPVSTLKSRVYTYIAFHVLGYGKWLKPFMQFYTRQVIEQDVDIMKNQGENLKKFINHKNISTDADEIHLAIELLRRLGSKGSEKLWTLSNESEKDFWI